MHNNDNALPNDTIDGDAFVLNLAREKGSSGRLVTHLRGRPQGDCLNFIEANWTDMRPRSLREC
jgi:hypothetical protein